MLTVKQPPTYGYKSVHDLPTPPSTSRPSPPLIYQESIPKSLPVTYRSHSPPNQPMSAPHRGLPPPAAMTLPPQQPPTVGVPPPSHHAPPPPPPPPSLGPSHQQRDPWAQLPAPPQQWQGAEEPMKHWLQARAEEDKRRQEEERTRQESLRLEQRKVEMEMLRTSLSGGIPPAMVPLVFAGMGSGGTLSQAALEWTQQFMPPSQGPRAQLMPPQGAVSPEHQRDAQPAPGQYHNLPPVPPPAPPGYAYPGSPTRPRGQTVAGTMGRPMGPVSNLPSINTNIPQHAQTGPPAMSSHQHMQQAQQHLPESQASPSIYFHHWQPPTSQASGSSNRPGSPSGSSKTKRKRDSLGDSQKAQGHGATPVSSISAPGRIPTSISATVCPEQHDKPVPTGTSRAYTPEKRFLALSIFRPGACSSRELRRSPSPYVADPQFDPWSIARAGGKRAQRISETLSLVDAVRGSPAAIATLDSITCCW
ncbi:hypothetical protein QQZ08_008239 [Neonectria magnoliae]|uniref:Uncharacterized protein n=1 Tax=Neonectria magnoliae TaxID=2732573 RepID=A0ABR1HVG7_9HYPO